MMNQPDPPPAVTTEDLSQAFTFLSPQQRAVMQSYVEVCRVGAAEMLFAVGDDADACYLLVAGTVAVKKQTGLGRNNQVIALLSPPAPVGEAALAGGGTRRTAVQVVSDATLLRLSTSDFQRLAGPHPEIALAILGRLLHISGLRLERCSTRLAHIL